MPNIVHSMDRRRKAFCALSARTRITALCDDRRMPKKHPVRPYLLPWRSKMGKTQEWLAEQIGVRHSTVNRQESGFSGVDDLTFAAIAKAYGITIAELSAHPDHSERARSLHRLMTRIANLSDSSIEALAGMAEQLPPSK